MLDILALGDYYCEITPEIENTGLHDLRDRIQRYCRERFRRIDRFSQLCLLGSSLCAEHALSHGLTMGTSTGLYIGSRFAALANTVDVHRRMMTRGQIPKPAHFINTLSNSAGYYVARNLALTGKNSFVSRADASLEAALQMVQLDLLSGHIQQALVGIVDEAVLPLSEHRQRLEVDPDCSLAEGSHWFLIRAASATADINALATITDVKCFYEQADAQEWIQQQLSASKHTWITGTTRQDEFLQTIVSNDDILRFDSARVYYPAQTAGALVQFIKKAKSGDSLISLYGDADNRFYLTRTERR